jgi:hypothetical protein
MKNGCDVNSQGPSCYNGKIGTHQAVVDYIFGQDLNKSLGFTQFAVYVDGNISVLGSDYIAGVNTPLVDGTQAYIVVAAIVGNLTPGEHTIGIGSSSNGVFGNNLEITKYKVLVLPNK